MKVLITCSGLGQRMGIYTKYTNKSLLKIGDNYVLDYIIELFKNINNVEFVITLGYYGDFIKQYIELAYSHLNVTFVTIDKYSGIGSSLAYSLLKVKDIIQEPFIYITCDTIIKDKLNYDKNYKITSNKVYVNKHNSSLNYASIICNKNNVLSFNHKNNQNFDYIYIGKSEIYDYEIFWNELEKVYNADKNNSSIGDVDVYINMLKNTKFQYKVVENYYDSGNVSIFNSKISKNNEYDVLVKADESISFQKETVVKFFHDKTKNLKRVERQKYLNNIIPKIIANTENFHIMEKIPVRPISENIENDIIKRLLDWANVNLWIKNDKPENFYETLYKFYYDKTMTRVKMALENSNINDYTTINKKYIGTIHELISSIDFGLLCNADAYNYHGDFILENILMKDNKFLLIDWREDFGGDLKNGDIYYDLSKLKHNIYLNHKNIEDGLFSIADEENNSCTVTLKCNYNLISQIKQFEEFVTNNNFNNDKINIIMSLIWINMAPLHDYPLSAFLFNFGKYNLYNYNQKITNQ